MTPVKIQRNADKRMKTERSKWYQHFVQARIIRFQSRKLLTLSSLTTDSR